MNISSGTKLGSYEIASALGAGGMGEVYRARDSRLERPVAIKVLSAEYSADAERLRRFEQEARSASALNHPNIVTIYEVGRQNGTAYLAMELVDGKTLRELLESGPIPLKKTLGIAAQVADGLAKAHGAGIVHRDLKPENVMITGDGLVKILDFGLAKLIAMPGEAGATATAVVPATHPGVVLGTVGYMSPEQARGANVDFRSDQFSLGTVLYEMLTGKRPFQRESSAQTMAAIIEDDPPPISELNPRAPAPVRWIVERCLAKEPEERYASTRDLARDLQRVRDHLSEASSGSVLGVTAPRAAGARRPSPALIIAALAGMAVGTVFGMALFRSHPTEPAVVENLTFSGQDSEPAASPDGRSVVFTSVRDGKSRIWLKQLPAGAEVPLTTGPDSEPRFSPDSSMIVFTRQEDGKSWVYRAAVVGGESRKLAHGHSPDWSPNGKQIAFVRGDSVWVMEPDGSNARELRSFEAGNSFLRALRWSPDGNWLTVQATSGGLSAENVRFQLVSRDGSQVVTVKPAFGGGDLSAVTWTGNDEVVYSRSSSTASVGAVSTSSSRLIRQKVPAGGAAVLLWLPGGSSAVDFLGGERMVVDLISSRENLRQVSLDRKRAAGDKWLSHGTSIDRQPVFSPDGKWVAFTSNRSGNYDVWAISTADGVVRRLTDDPTDDWDPGFTPDGKLLWTSHRTGNFEIWISEADGSGAHQVSHDGIDAENATATRDGWIIYNSGSKEPGLWKVRQDGSQAKVIVPGIHNWPEASPDGQFVMATGLRIGSFVGGEGPRRPAGSYIGVYRIADGAEIFRIALTSSGANVLGLGRARWMPDGRSIVFISTDEKGVAGIFQQDFAAGKDTSATRHALMVDPDRQPETFGIAPDGSRMIFSVVDLQSNLLRLDKVKGVSK